MAAVLSRPQWVNTGTDCHHTTQYKWHNLDRYGFDNHHYRDVIMDATASQITSLTIVYSTVYSDVDQRKHQSSASQAFVREIHRGPVNSPHKWPVTRKKFPFDDVIMTTKSEPFACHDDVIKWTHFPRYWPFVRGIYRSPVDSPHKGQWHGALMISLIAARRKNWSNNRDAGDLRHQRDHYDVTVMYFGLHCTNLSSYCFIKVIRYRIYPNNPDCLTPLRHLLLTWINFKPTWISTYIEYKVRDEIIYQFPNFNGTTVDVWE